VSHPTSIEQSIQSHIWADRLRNLATVLVIAIHVAGPVAQGNTDYHTSYWWAGNLWDSFARPSVPLFVMLSGFLLLGKDYPLGNFLKRRFSRVVIPALFWMTVFSLYNHLATNEPATLGDALRRVVENEVHYHLWFIYLIIGLYLTYPILRPWVRGATERDYRYFFVLCIIGTWLYKILYQFFDIGIGIYMELFTNEVGNFVLGYYLGSKIVGSSSITRRSLGEGGGSGQDEEEAGLIAPWPFSRRKMIFGALMMIVLGTAVTAYGTYWASISYGGKFHPYFYDYLTPNVGIAAIGWFILAQQCFHNTHLVDFEKEFASASFGIYFIHVMVLDWWSRTGYWSYKYHPALCIPVVLCVVVLTSFLGVVLLRALPGGKKVT